MGGGRRREKAPRPPKGGGKGGRGNADWQSAQYKESNGGKNAIEGNKEDGGEDGGAVSKFNLDAKEERYRPPDTRQPRIGTILFCVQRYNKFPKYVKKREKNRAHLHKSKKSSTFAAAKC